MSLGLLKAVLRATSEFPLHLQALGGVKMGHEADQFWGYLPRGSPYKRCWRQGHFGGLWDDRKKGAWSESVYIVLLQSPSVCPLASPKLRGRVDLCLPGQGSHCLPTSTSQDFSSQSLGSQGPIFPQIWELLSQSPSDSQGASTHCASSSQGPQSIYPCSPCIPFTTPPPTQCLHNPNAHPLSMRTPTYSVQQAPR